MCFFDENFSMDLLEGGESMGMVHNYKNKAVGKLKQVQGSVKQQEGGMEGAKGGLRRMEGRVQEVMADAKIALEKNKQQSEVRGRV